MKIIFDSEADKLEFIKRQCPYICLEEFNRDLCESFAPKVCEECFARNHIDLEVNQ